VEEVKSEEIRVKRGKKKVNGRKKKKVKREEWKGFVLKFKELL
jgi:hypothetical protein